MGLSISAVASDIPYNRADYGYKTVYFFDVPSFYRGSTDCPLQADHVVSLHDAHNSGAKYWTAKQKHKFANDRENIVPACADVNQAKSNRTPKDFYRITTDKKGVEISWKKQRFCTYLTKYYAIKEKYNLTTHNNKIFQCEQIKIYTK